jgi:SAM-dependent methyltransferase
MNNYEFCVQWVSDQECGSNIRVLDYGCGAGEIVKKLRHRGINAFGCDVFYEGGDYSSSVDAALLGSVIRKIEGATIPFDVNSFDFVINNQVMEHVKDIDGVLCEIQRVLKPGGAILSLFPDKGVWREGHCGIAFLHWFPKCSHPRVYYAAACRALGFGYYKEDKSIMRWSRDFCKWLDNWTCYRTRQQINESYGKYFRDIKHIEDYWLRLRLGQRQTLINWLPASAQRLAVRKLAGLVFVAHASVAPELPVEIMKAV